MLVLAIETSCDETGTALYDSERGLLADALFSQVALHNEFGGVVPELASRDHVRKVLPLIEQVMQQANVSPDQIDALAYTAGPGLIGAVLVGAAIGRSLAYAWNVPSIAVHHMESHLLAPMLEADPPSYPFVALLVSGGHTLLVKVNSFGDYRVLGQSLDDAAGEAFDKTAKILGLSYPGGAELAKLAQQGDPTRFEFPRPMVQKPGLDFSFSGLKTHALNTLSQYGDEAQTLSDIACAFELAVVDTLVIKCRRALQQTGLTRLVVAGGVGANAKLRVKLHQLMKKHQWQVYFPRAEFCTDNGAMVAYAGCMHLLAKRQDQDLTITAKPRWDLAEIEGKHFDTKDSAIDH